MTTDPAGPNPYALAARTRKASALYAALNAGGYTADQAAEFPDDARRIVATLAGVNPPSEATWDETVGLLRQHGNLAAITAKALDRLIAR